MQKRSNYISRRKLPRSYRAEPRFGPKSLAFEIGLIRTANEELRTLTKGLDKGVVLVLDFDKV